MTHSLDDALAVQSRIGLFDLHLDSIIQDRLFGYDIRKRHRAGVRGQPFFWHADLPRMRDARYGAACMGIHGWPWESEGVWEAAMRQIDVLDALCRLEPDCLRIRHNGEWSDVSPGRLLLAPGVEGAHLLNGKLERVQVLAERGVAYVTLTHFSKNSAATPAIGRGANEEDGLTAFGRELIASLNDAGIAIDVSHANQRCAIEACTWSRAPVFATHSGLQALHPHARLLSDAAVEAIASTGGVIGVIFAPGYLGPRLRASTRVVADHIEALVNKVGEDHVAIGTDLDGWLPAIPNDMRDCRDTVRLTHDLLQRGFTETLLRKVLRGNAMRAFRAVYQESCSANQHLAT